MKKVTGGNISIFIIYFKFYILYYFTLNNELSKFYINYQLYKNKLHLFIKDGKKENGNKFYINIYYIYLFIYLIK